MRSNRRRMNGKRVRRSTTVAFRSDPDPQYFEPRTTTLALGEKKPKKAKV